MELEAESKKRSLTTAEELERKHLQGRLYAYLYMNVFFDPRRLNYGKPNEELTPDDEADLRRTMRFLGGDLLIPPDRYIPPPIGAIEGMIERLKAFRQRQ
jgi:hypothetical protein